LSRRLARQIAFQTLFQIDLAKSSTEDSLQQRLSDVVLAPDDEQYVYRAVRGVTEQMNAINAQISAVSKDWEIGRLGTVDRNILRLAVYEIVFMDDIPVRVSINEAVELAKEFGDRNSPRFINGVLGTVVRDGGFQ
jgi:N utilization substance protein B